MESVWWRNRFYGPNSTDKHTHEWRHLFSYVGSVAMAKMLLSHIPDINAKDAQGLTVLDKACIPRNVTEREGDWDFNAAPVLVAAGARPGTCHGEALEAAMSESVGENLNRLLCNARSPYSAHALLVGRRADAVDGRRRLGVPYLGFYQGATGRGKGRAGAEGGRLSRPTPGRR